MHSVTVFLVGIAILGLSPILLGVVYVIRRTSDERRARSGSEDLRGRAAP